MKKFLPIGISDYKKLIDGNYYYVDKTTLIGEIWDSGEVVLVPRPRRFGKTLNLSMLHYFFEINEAKTEYLFNNTAIRRDPRFQALQGNFPVIFLTFKNIAQTTFSDIYDSFAAAIGEEFNRHKYLLSSDELDTYEKELFSRIRESKSTRVELENSLDTLSRFLHRHHQKQVIILIDEYDVPVQSAFIHHFYNEIIEFLRPLLTGAFKDNKILAKGVITGIMTLAKAGIFTGLNNLDVFNLTHNKLADKFGFTLEEARTLFSYYEIQNQEKIQQWYNGYTFGKTQSIFNPWSAIKCAQNQGNLEIYWANTSDNVLIKRLIARASRTIKSELELILTGKTVTKIIEESIVFPDVDKQQELIWSLLLFTGYLTYVRCELQGGKKECELVTPNFEIKYLYEDLIRKIFQETVVEGQVPELLQAILQGDTETFSELLQGFILNSMSVYDLSSKEPEKSYHLFILGVLVTLSDTHEIKSNRESGFGRYDIMIIPKDPTKNGVIMEFKKVIQDDLPGASQKALHQILQKNYVQELRSRHIEKIIAYGIAFEGKNVYVTSQVIRT